MKKQIVHVLGCSAGLLAALLLSLALLGLDTHVAAAQGIAQQTPMTGTMPMSGTMPGMAGMGQMGDMSAMMEMMKNMDARMAKMEDRMAQMQGSMPMTGTMPGMGGMSGMGQGGMSGMGGMMGQGDMMGKGGMSGMMNGNHQQMHMMMQMMMMHMMMQMMDESGSMPCPMMSEGGMSGMGSMMGQGGMSGMGGMMGEGGMMSPQAGGEQAEHPAEHTAGPMSGASAAEAHSAELGGISVKATPANLENRSGETLDFSVDLEAQGQALDFDVAKLAKLMVGSQEVPASGWTVNFDHGHHVNGTLSFPLADIAAALTPGTKIMLHISEPDGAGQAMFDWEVEE